MLTSKTYCFTRRILKEQNVFAIRCPTISALKMSTSVKPDDTSHLSKPKFYYKSFAKELFIGKFEQNMLVFPEVLKSSELQELNEMIQPIDRFFSEQLDSKSIDENAKIPEDVLTEIKKLGLFGMEIPQEYGGLGLNATQYARINEACSTDGSIAVTLAAHQAIGLKGILLFGTEEQKQQYLPKLAAGEYTAAFCLTEPSSGSDAASIQTKATLSKDGKTYNLNGGKIWISNGGIADIFTVFTRTEVKNPKGGTQDKISAFIVERAFGGVTSGKPEDKLGIRGSNTCEVHFEDTPVPVENMLGDIGDGLKVALTILNSGRFSMGSSSASGIRKLLAMVCEHAISRKQFGKPLKDFGLIQDKIGKMAVAAYVMESMSYATAAILDTYDNPDASIEAAMVKVYSSEQAWTCVNEALQIMGGAGYMKDYPFERYLRDTRIMLIFEGTNEILRLFIAMSGLQYAGIFSKDLLSKMNDPLNNLGLIWTIAANIRRQRKTKYKLYDHVHPVLSECAANMEVKLHEFSDVVLGCLRTYKDDVINEQMLCKRLADISIDMYGMTCVLARASRSKTIGLRHCDHEIMLAMLFCQEACGRIDQHIQALQIGKHNNGDEYYRLIAEDLFKNRGYVAEHPLNRNWN